MVKTAYKSHFCEVNTHSQFIDFQKVNLHIWVFLSGAYLYKHPSIRQTK